MTKLDDSTGIPSAIARPACKAGFWSAILAMALSVANVVAQLAEWRGFSGHPP